MPITRALKSKLCEQPDRRLADPKPTAHGDEDEIGPPERCIHVPGEKPGTANVAIAFLGEHISLIETVSGWLHQQWFSGSATPGDVDRRLRQQTNRNRMPVSFVARIDGAAAGVASLMADCLPTGEVKPFLTELFVAESFRRQGVGTALCQRVKLQAAEFGHSELFLYTRDTARFFRKQGWLDHGQVTVPTQAGRETVSMMSVMTCNSRNCNPSGS